MSSTNIRVMSCFVDVLELEDKSEELIELLSSYGFTDEDGNLTKAGYDLVNGMDE